MPMVKKSISVTDQQDSWIKAQIKTGHYGNESEVVRELIRERQQSGFSDRSVDEIWEEARQRHRAKGA